MPDNQVKTMKTIRKLNPKIKFLATNRSDYHGYKQGNCNNFPTFIYDYSKNKDEEKATGTKALDSRKYGIFLADYIEYMYKQLSSMDLRISAPVRNAKKKIEQGYFERNFEELKTPTNEEFDELIKSYPNYHICYGGRCGWTALNSAIGMQQSVF